MDDSIRNMIIGSIVLVLASMYGGDTLGSWFHWEKEIDYNDGDSEQSTTEFYLEGYKWEYEFDAGGETGYEDDDADSDPDYDDNDCWGGDCDEMADLMQGKIQNLLYVVILAGGAALYFVNDGDQEKGALACLAMGGAGLLAAGLFALNFPEAFDDDTEAFELIDEDPSLLGDDNDYGEELGIGAEDTKVNWRPGLALILVAFSGLLGMGAYAELKT